MPAAISRRPRTIVGGTHADEFMGTAATEGVLAPQYALVVSPAVAIVSVLDAGTRSSSGAVV